MNSILVNDYVICEEICNGSCKYCLTAMSKFKDKHLQLLFDDRIKFDLNPLLDGRMTYQKDSALKHNIDFVANWVSKQLQPLILKISGGEILLIKNIEEFIHKQCFVYKRVQMLTNGFLLNKELLEKLKDILGFCLQISMDGHTLELNSNRVQNPQLQKKLCDIVELTCQLNLPLEINCVITNTNCLGLEDFACYLNKYPNVLLLPYPIRGQNREKFWPSQNDLNGLSQLILNYDKYRKILPPIKYLEKLYSFYLQDEILDRCWIAKIMVQSFDDGILTPCPNVWYKSLGNVLDNPLEVERSIQEDKFYQIIKRHGRAIKQCRECFTPWEIVNLYLNHEIELSDLKNIYLYNDPMVLKFLSGVNSNE
jgi:MoaA/NifB/PqqE/SkfB family radical SAM enzyme